MLNLSGKWAIIYLTDHINQKETKMKQELKKLTDAERIWAVNNKVYTPTIAKRLLNIARNTDAAKFEAGKYHACFSSYAYSIIANDAIIEFNRKHFGHFKRI